MLAILNELRHGSQTANAGVGDVSRLREELRRNPDLLHAVEPLLTDDLLRQLADDDGDDTNAGGIDDPDLDDDVKADKADKAARDDRARFTRRRPK